MENTRSLWLSPWFSSGIFNTEYATSFLHRNRWKEAMKVDET